MKVKKTYLLVIILFLSLSTAAQQKDVLFLKIDSGFDIRKAAAEYFGNADLWPFILKYNNLKRLDEIKPGATLLIPQKKVSTLLALHEKAKESLQKAIMIGARVLTIETLSRAEENYSKALQQKEFLEYDQSIQSAQQSIELAEAAYKQTKEIRDKTIDAIVSYKKGTLQKRFTNALSWQSAELYENLKENDMARTLALSIARITFNDLSQIKLNENSMAVIQRSRIDPLTNKTTSQVKLEKGDAYASLLNSPKKKFDLDIPGVKTEINSKYFWVEKNPDETKLANYNGEIKLEAKDVAVTVKKNQGSVIPKGGTPTAPSELLPPPDLILPGDQNKYDNTTVNFTWKKIAQAESYWIQLSYDSGFNNVYLLRKDIKNEKTEITNIPPGTYYWRVCAVDKFGLPGNYSPANGFVLFNNNIKPYLVIDEPGKDFFTSNKVVKITGRTLSTCKVLIGNSLVLPDKDGKFESDYSLIEGKNIVAIKAIDPSGNQSVIYQNIYYESTPEVELSYANTGESFNSPQIFTNKEFHIIELRTRPYAQIKIENEINSEKNIYYADSTGKFFLPLRAFSKTTLFKLTIISKSGFEKSIDFSLVQDAEAPILKINPFAKMTIDPKLKLSGKVEDAKSLLVNGKNVEIKKDNYFETEITAVNGKNQIEFIASDEAGNIIRKIESVIVDNQPPKLESANVVRDKEKKGIATILIRTNDETGLTNYANVEYNTQNRIVNDYLTYNKTNGVYELDVPDTPDLKIISVILSDYLSNEKKYLVK